MIDIIAKIDELTKLSEGYTDDVLKNDLSALRQKLTERKLYVVVVGLFKRGKSTLINSLLNDTILPSSVTPVTALITIVEYGNKPSATVIFKDNASVKIAMQEVDEYVTEEKNPDNEKHVQYVHISHPASLLRQISLVDSPGLGSAYEHNTEATLSFIPRIDTALFLLSADIPVSKIDLELLHELRQRVPKIIFVLNKADLLSQSDLNKLARHNKSVLSKELRLPEEEIPFYIVSCLHRTSENFISLVNAIESVGVNEKDNLLQVSSMRHLQLLNQKAILQLQFVADACQLPIYELEQRQKQLSASIALMHEQKDEFASIVTGKIKALQQLINEDVNTGRRKINNEVKITIDSIASIDEATLYNMQRDINKMILISFERIKDEWETKAKEHFTSLLEQYSRRSQSFLHELNANLSAFLGENMNLLFQQFDLSAYSSFYLTLDSGMPSPDSSSFFLNSVLPVTLKRKRIQDKWLRHYSEVITRNTASILYDLSYKIQESFRRFNHDLSGKMNEVLLNMKEKIQDVIASKTKTALQSEHTIGDINYRLEQLKKIK